MGVSDGGGAPSHFLLRSTLFTIASAAPLSLANPVVTVQRQLPLAFCSRVMLAVPAAPLRTSWTRHVPLEPFFAICRIAAPSGGRTVLERVPSADATATPSRAKNAAAAMSCEDTDMNSVRPFFAVSTDSARVHKDNKRISGVRPNRLCDGSALSALRRRLQGHARSTTP